jgi:hypothetical protein
MNQEFNFASKTILVIGGSSGMTTTNFSRPFRIALALND